MLVRWAGCSAYPDMLEISCCALICCMAGTKRLQESHQGEKKEV